MAADPQTLANDAAAAILRLLNDFRVHTIAAILASPEPLSGSYKQLLAEINTLLTTYQRQTTVSLVSFVTNAAAQGDAQVLDDAQAAGIDVPLAYVGVSEQLVRTAADYSASLVTNLTNVARSAIEQEVRRAALGGKSTMALIEAIGRNLDDASVFKGIAARAEAIARTEVSRVYNMAHFDGGTTLAGRYTGLRKQWLHSSQAVGATGHQRSSARPNHVACAEATARDPIPFNQDFDLGDFTARYPHDPLLPASQTVNCRCRLQLVPPS